MMRILSVWLVVVGFWLGSVESAEGAEVRMTNGDVYRGEPVSFDDDGVVMRLDIGGFSQRLSWSQMTQETLKELAKNKQAAPFAEAFIELTPEEEQQRKPKKEIVIQPVERFERPAKPNFFAAFASPVGLFVFGVLYLANLFAAFEIAVFKQRPVILVVAVSALLPIVGPIIFLSLPPSEEMDVPAAVPEMEHAAVGAGAPGARATGQVPAAPPASGLSVAQTERSGGSTPVAEPAVYKRGDVTFNRRFFEAKFPGFFRIVPSESEKDLVMVVRAARNEYVARRISRISMNDMHLQLLRGTSEVSVPFGEIIEVQIRHKDAKA